MKYTFTINQAGVVRCGLLGRVDLPALCLLEYIGGWFHASKRKRVIVAEVEYVWLCSKHAIEELPLLFKFNPKATDKTRKNQLSRLVCSLREAELVESVRVGGDLYLRPSGLADEIAHSRERTVPKSDPTLPQKREGSIPLLREDSLSTIYNDSGTNDSEIINTHPPGGRVSDHSAFSSSQQEAEIFAAYPKKVGKPVALRAIRRALAKHPFDFLLARTRLFAKTYTGEPRYIPNPAKWFDQERFNDDPATWGLPIQSACPAPSPAPCERWQVEKDLEAVRGQVQTHPKMTWPGNKPPPPTVAAEFDALVNRRKALEKELSLL